MGIRKRLSNAFDRARYRKVDGVQVPREWLEKPKEQTAPNPTMPKEQLQGPKGFVILEKQKQPRVIHIPKLRALKRFVAFILAIFNFLISQGALAGGGQAQGLAIFFLLTAGLLFDYVWQMRKRNP